MRARRKTTRLGPSSIKLVAGAGFGTGSYPGTSRQRYRTQTVVGKFRNAYPGENILIESVRHRVYPLIKTR